MIRTPLSIENFYVSIQNVRLHVKIVQYVLFSGSTSTGPSFMVMCSYTWGRGRHQPEVAHFYTSLSNVFQIKCQMPELPGFLAKYLHFIKMHLYYEKQYLFNPWVDTNDFHSYVLQDLEHECFLGLYNPP